MTTQAQRAERERKARRERMNAIDPSESTRRMEEARRESFCAEKEG